MKFLLVIWVLQLLEVNWALIVLTSTELNQVASRQNSLEQGEHLFTKLTPRLNETDYFIDFRTCLTDPKPMLCMKYVNNYQRQFVKLWDPKLDKSESYPRFEQDCTYIIKYAGNPVSDSSQIRYQFVVEQSNCTSKATVLGGASFETFGVSSHALASCATIDLFNNQYNITCILPTPTQPTLLPVCINMTMLLMYEHFDGVSETIPEWSHKYPPMRSVLVNNEPFCTPAQPHNKVSNKPIHSMSNLPVKLNVPDNVRWFTGSWVHNSDQRLHVSPFCANSSLPYKHPQCYYSTAHSNFAYEHVLNSATDAYRHSRLYLKKTEYEAPINTSRLTFPAIAAENPAVTADKYTFQSVLYTGDATSIVASLNDRDIYSGCVSRGLDRELCKNVSTITTTTMHKSSSATTSPTKSTYIPESKLIRNITTDNNHMYHFIGSSHMRFNFDAVAEYYLGISALDGVNRKHDSITLRNFKFDYESIARHQTEYLTRLCHTLQNGTVYKPSVNHTIIFQTGAWDFSLAGLRLTIKDPISMPHLLSIFQSIFDGSLPCGGLKKIVFLTALPHANCFDDSEWKCNGHRSFRTNVAIEALNDFLVSNLLRISQMPYQAQSYNARKLSATRASVQTKTASPIHQVRNKAPLHRFEMSNEARSNNTKSVRVESDPVAVKEGSASNDAAVPINTPHIRLSIIDTYAIIHPRLLFNEQGELACLNHFTCRVHIKPCSKSALLQTPGGAAVVKSILTALSLE